MSSGKKYLNTIGLVLLLSSALMVPMYSAAGWLGDAFGRLAHLPGALWHYAGGSIPDVNQELLEAVLSGNIGEIEQLIQAGASPDNLVAPAGPSIFFVAVKSGNLDVVTELVRCGANVNAHLMHDAKEFGLPTRVLHYKYNTPLCIAISCGHVEIARYLIVCGADLNADSACALQRAIYSGNIDLLAQLVKMDGFDVNARDLNGKTLLHHAVGLGSLQGYVDEVLKVMNILIFAGARVGIRDNNGNTPYDLAEGPRVRNTVSWGG
jgi:ankyrin repeat protein